jgi:hypothetical protein
MTWSPLASRAVAAAVLLSSRLHWPFVFGLSAGYNRPVIPKVPSNHLNAHCRTAEGEENAE